MGFCIVAGKRMEGFKGYAKTGNVFCKVLPKASPAPLESVRGAEDIAIAVGDVFSSDAKRLVQDSWETVPTTLLQHLGEFSLAKTDSQNNRIHFASSQAGIENLYYYSHDGVFLVTDDFWEALDVIEPKRADICAQSLLEAIAYPYPLNYRTVISGLMWLPPATVGTWDGNHGRLTLTKYWEFRYRVDESLTLRKAVDGLDSTLDRAMGLIKAKCGDVQYAVGLSGGLDSRLLPYYALKNGMKLRAFIVADKHPRSFLLSSDHQSARQLARHFGIELTEVPAAGDGLAAQLEHDVRTYPLGPPALAKLVQTGVPPFDVLLTGGSGLIVGDELPSDIDSMSGDDLLAAIKQHCGRLKEVSRFKNRVSRALKYLFNIDVVFRPRTPHSALIPEEARQRMEQEWRRYVEDGRSRGLTNVDIYEDYFNNYLGFRSRLGAFESLAGAKRSFSIYVPFAFRETLKWAVALLKDRRALKSLISEKMPELAGVKGQSFYVAVNRQNASVARKALTMADFLLRGSGTGSVGGRRDRRALRKALRDVVSSQTEWFNEIVDRRQVMQIVNSGDLDLAYMIAKRKRVVDLVETKEYRRYVQA